MAAAYDAAGNVNPQYAGDINAFAMALAQAQTLGTGSTATLTAAQAAITSDGVTGIASAAFVN